MITLSNDGVMALAAELGVQTLPLVLAVGPQQTTHAEWNAAQERARAEIRAARLVDAHGDVTADAAESLFVLAQPDRELAARIVTPDGLVRLCVARRGEAHAVAVRRDDRFTIQPLWTDGSGSSLARPILELLGSCPPAEVVNFSATAAELAERFDAAAAAADYTNVFYALGMNETDATAYGLALGSCHAHAEVVAYAYTDGVTERSPGAAVVYDTARGRIASALGVAPDQQLWSTLTPGTDHRIAQAITTLIESLPGRRWLP
ncbi:ESX secretion-associated protein EspG [Nocardia sp. NPDC005978]|uniref:ESX secretion-associated protein EspG n=1 Tax=Nocardia sp. NPDC005978 TaxID=3156725 RepID=UPI0033A67F69